MVNFHFSTKSKKGSSSSRRQELRVPVSSLSDPNIMAEGCGFVLQEGQTPLLDRAFYRVCKTGSPFHNHTSNRE